MVTRTLAFKQGALTCTKHLNIMVYHTRGLMAQNIISIIYTLSADPPSDLLRKALTKFQLDNVCLCTESHCKLFAAYYITNELSVFLNPVDTCQETVFFALLFDTIMGFCVGAAGDYRNFDTSGVEGAMWWIKIEILSKSDNVWVRVISGCAILISCRVEIQNQMVLAPKTLNYWGLLGVSCC